MIAFVREVSPRLEWPLPPDDNGPTVDAKRLRAEHAGFIDVLKAVGATVRLVPAVPDRRDGIFVEGAAVVLSEAIVIARPGDHAGQPETETVAAALAEYRPLVRIAASAMLDGGDVLRIGNTLFVARSARTDAEGIAALAEAVEPFGYDVQTVSLRDSVHLKTACTFIPPHFLVANPYWVDLKPFGGLKVIEVDRREPLAANTFTLAGTTLVSGAFRRTEQRLIEAGISTRRVDFSELHKANAGVSALCLLLEPRVVRAPEASARMRFVRAPEAHRTTDFFSPAIVHGGLVYVSGQLPLDPFTGRPIDGTAEEQMEQVLRNLADVLNVSGSAITRLLKLTIYVADLKLAERVKAVCMRICAGHRPTGFLIPTRALEAGCLVAADAIATIADE